MEKTAIINTRKINPGKRSGYLFQRTACLVFLFLFTGLAAGFADLTVMKSPLSWSEGESGDYALPALVNAEYVLPGFVATEGQIKTLCVNYDAAGKVAVEVSADNGLHYNPVINGVPLKSGFVSGDRLRWRAQALSDEAKLYSLKIAYTDTAGLSGTFGEPTLSGFKYRQAVLIKNPGEEVLYNYQLKLILGESASVKGVDLNCSSKSLADFKDIRFTAADAETPLPYYRESIAGSVGSRSAVFWVKVPQIPKAGVTVYLYYGNAAAEDLSNPDETFDFFEDFESSELDKNKWLVHLEPKGSAEISLGKMKLDAAEIISKNFKFKEGIIEYACFVGSGFENSLNLRNKTDDSYDIPIWLAYASAYKGAEHCIAVDGVVKANDGLTKPQVPGETYNYRLNVLGGKIIFERWDATNQELQASVIYQSDLKVKSGYLGLRSGGDGGGKNLMNFGTLRVRKSAESLPIIEGSGKEEAVALPVFVNTILSENGNLILKADTRAGYYISPDIVSADPARIIIPDWDIDSASKTTFDLGISTDQGLTYKSNCEKEKFYYASRKDFTAGTNLKVRVDLSGDSATPSRRGLSSAALDYRPGKINIIAPNGGEVITSGSQREITWSAQDYESSYPVNIEYSTDAGKNYTLIAGNLANSGDYLWTAAGDSQRVLVKVADANEDSIFDVSDKVFSIRLTEESGVSEYFGGNGKWNNTAAWSTAKVPDLTSDVRIASGVTIYADEPVSFRSLSIGDGQGKVTTTVVLKAGVNSGSGEIIIRKGGKLIQEGQEPIVITGNLSVKSGGILSHLPKSGINITAKNINLEPGSKVDAEAKNKHAGGTVNLSASGDFNIFGTITADGDKQKGGKGGAIYLTAGTFGGKNALITADGGYSKANPDNYGIFIPKGAGTISGLVSTSSGDN
jgi:hypothetical protein